ncbi:spfh domain band 7 family protein [Plakobranchus ocellatus]|uniref:Spfh domain band 7 family protein n=1 Tax=Plakobranchus ocellatus TaxID=259542 RepID=A0AAV3ZZB5_9GAST|nr:spfh domain band 7 family protein [Plakobranchus ocellatus]
MEKKYCLILVGVAAVLILIISLVASSLKKLSSTEVGLQYDKIQKDLDGKVYTEGLHLGPVGYEFIKFPNIYTTMTFHKLQCLNSDGVRINLDVTYQYRVQMTNLKKIVMDFKDFDGYKRVLHNVGVASLHESCSYFDTVQFQANRGDFQDKLEAILIERYEDVGCEVGSLQVNNIQRPKEYESAIRRKERAKGDIKVAEEERPKIVTEANTTLREAISEAQIIVDKAMSDSRVLASKAEAEAEAILEQYKKESEAYSSILDQSGLAFTPEAFISYLGVRVIADAKNPVYIGMQSPAKTSYLSDDKGTNG